MNRISIIVPVYNIEAQLPRCIDSVLFQTYRDLEVILVDDGSTDSCPTLCDSYAIANPRVRVIHQENGGVTSARLRGVQEATGEWIIFCDGDDIPEPEMYEQLLKNALEYGADISHCGYQMVFPNGRVVHYHGTGCIVEQDHLQGLRDLLAGGLVEPGLWNKLFRRELFLGLDAMMDGSFKINEDLLMNYHLFKAADRSVFEDKCLYNYVLRRGSVATGQLNEHKLADPIGITKAILADAVPALHDVLIARLARQLIALATMSDKQQRELILPHRQAARKELRSRLSEILREDIGLKLKIMVLWTALWPTGYSWIHSTYARITGLEKAYDLE